MKNKELELTLQIESLKSIIADFHWMARRYADGRRSYCASLFNQRTQEALMLGVVLNSTSDKTVWAKFGDQEFPVDDLGRKLEEPDNEA